MADNKRWFKVWNSILTDPSFLDLPLEQIGRWSLLGALISLHGENGKITLSRDSLYSLLRCKNDNGNDNGLTLPNVCFEEGQSDNGKVTVIMKNWAKYQMDSTSYERLKKFRNKANDNGARGDKEETKRRGEKEPPISPKGDYIPFQEIICYLNEKSGKTFQCETQETRRCIRARWNAGFRLHDFKKVIDNMTLKWKADERMVDYLRPITLFGTKFESYLNTQGEIDWKQKVRNA